MLLYRDTLEVRTTRVNKELERDQTLQRRRTLAGETEAGSFSIDQSRFRQASCNVLAVFVEIPANSFQLIH